MAANLPLDSGQHHKSNAILRLLKRSGSHKAQSHQLTPTILTDTEARTVLPPKPTRLVTHCCCCGQILAYPESASKFKCSVCATTTILEPNMTESPKPLTYEKISHLVDDSISRLEDCQLLSLHEAFHTLSHTLHEAFGSSKCLNMSFLVNTKSKALHYSRSNLDNESIRRSFWLLAKLPTLRPLYNALAGSVELLKRNSLSTIDIDDPRKVRFLLVLLEIPFLSSCVTYKSGTPKMASTTDIRSLLFEILSRSIGILAHSKTSKSTSYICSWFARLPQERFSEKVLFLNLYITLRLRKLTGARDKRQRPHGDTCTQSHDHHNKLDGDPVSAGAPQVPAINSDGKERLRINQYGHDWQIQSAATVLGMYFTANSIRVARVPCNAFYNSVVDYVQIKMDFDCWQSRKGNESNRTQLNDNLDPDLQSVIAYIQESQRTYRLDNNFLFYFCQYPFLISLGAKISILEYEAKRKMERKAEEAFINLMDKKSIIDVYLRIRVRRDHVVQDSLRCIQQNETNLRKSLRVHFIGEPGIDAGGLKKEWFLILTRSLFSPQSGMFKLIDESNVLWFTLVPANEFSMYFLFGATLGLAIYNSTILDLNFPRAFYKFLLGGSLEFRDYLEIYPTTSRNLVKLQCYSESELSQMGLYFEVTFKDAFGKVHTKELIKNGHDTVVSTINVNLYIAKYSDYFINEGIAQQLCLLRSGFATVMKGNALSLFHYDELELLICGSDDKSFDIDVLRLITKYNGFKDREDADKSKLVKWFWQYVQQLDTVSRKAFLVFVTGSDRVPATGLQNLSFRLSVVPGFSERLPVAHTCFNELEIYEYPSKEKLFEKLEIAIHESSGFGMK